MDLVYITSPQSSCDDLELRYSIRSMVKHLKGWERLVIVGHCPNFLKEVIHIPATDPYPFNRAGNIFLKILHACHDAEVSQQFICASDDHFLLKDYQAETFPYYQCGSLIDTFNRLGTDNYYKKHVEATIQALTERNLPTVNFNIHSPILYSKSDFIRVVSMYDWTVPKGYISKSLYCNTLGIEGEFLKDNKIHQPFTKTAILRRLQNVPMFSTNEHSVNDPMKEVLQELYPKHSPWENTFCSK